MTDNNENKLTQLEYDNLIGPYKEAMDIVILKLNGLNKELRDKQQFYPIHTIQDRIKSKSSLENKLIKRKINCDIDSIKENITDIAGIRVICYSVEDVYNMVNMIRKLNDKVEIKISDYIQNPKPNGYKSYHIVLGIGIYRTNGMEYYPVEIQFRTIGMEFWASMEHRYCYKNNQDGLEKRKKDFTVYAEEIYSMERKMTENSK